MIAREHSTSMGVVRAAIRLRGTLSRPLAAALVSAALLWPAHPAQAQFTQEGNKLVGTGAAASAQQGISVAVSGDGNTAIMGGPGDNSGVGAAWVFTRS